MPRPRRWKRPLDETRDVGSIERSLPFAALGVLSGTSHKVDSVHSRFVTRRRMVRSTWMQLENINPGRGARRGMGFVVRFILRCGGLPANHSARSEPDVLCTPVPAQESRLRGPILALYFWFAHALKTYPTATYICKSDDDVFLYSPDIEAHLHSIPSASAPFAYYGAFNFYHLSERLPSESAEVIACR